MPVSPMGDVLDPTDEVGAYAVQESTCSSGSPRARKIVGRKAGLIAEAVQNVMIFKKREHAVLGYSKSSVFALAIAATAWPLWATPAFAQSESEGVGPVPASGNLVDGNEIIVTARKKEESLRDVPAAISVASGEKLEALGIREADDLEALTPGFVYRPSPQGSPTFQIRGVGFFEEAIGVSPTVTAYVDQAPLPFSVMAQGALFDVERIEVLKGPQGTLFGQNSTGGAINFVAAKPTNSPTAGFDAEYGRFQSYLLGGYVSGPLTDNLKVRASVRAEGRDGWQKTFAAFNSGTGVFDRQKGGDGRRLGSRDFKIGRLIAEWEPSPSSRFTLNLTGWEDRSETQAQQFIIALPETPGNVGSVPFWSEFSTFPPAGKNVREADWDTGRSFKRDDNFRFASLSGQFDLSNSVTLDTITSYARIKLSRPTDLDGTPLPSVFIINGGVLETISQEVRLSGNHDAFNWILGGNYQDDDTLEQQDITLNLSNSLPFFDHAIQDMDGRAKTWAIFGAVGYGLSENVNAQISARYTDSSRRMAGCTRDGGNGKFTDFISLVFSLPPIPPGACGTLNTQTFVPELIRKQFSEDNVSWKASIDWKPVPEAMLYASVTRGYKAGNFVNITAIFSDSLAPVPQEKITAYEMGLKADAFDSNLNLTVNAFYYDYKNKQLTGFSDGGVFGTINAVVSIPESRVIGGELQLSLKVMPGVTLDHSSSYLSTKVNGDFLALDAAGNTEQRRGEAFPGTPKFQMANRVNVDLPVSPSRSIFGNISVVTRSGSKTNFGSDPLFEVPAYTLVNGQIGLGLGRYRVSAFAENIFNKVYHSIVQATGDNVTKVAGLPFQFGARISYKY